jgi:hypothetical protein
MTAKSPPGSKRTIYVPPDRDTIYAMAKDVCARMAEESGDPSYNDPETITGLADFIGIVAKMKANALNRGSAVDQAKTDS